MLNLSQLISDFEACIGFPYASPGTNDERGGFVTSVITLKVIEKMGA